MERQDEYIEKLLGGYSPPFTEGGKELAKAKVMSRTVNAEERIFDSAPWTSKYRLGIAAAVVLFILSLPFAVHWFGLEKISTMAEKSVVLPDGSEVELSGEGELSLNTWIWPLYRSVGLTGEAIFYVKEGRSFTVHTNQADIEVLGTVFSVRKDEESLLVHCREGLVKVENSILTGGEYIILDRDLVKQGIWKVNPPTVKEMSESMRFDRVPLEWVKEALEERFNTKINLKTKKSYVFTGSLESGELQSSLLRLCRPLGLKYTTNRDAVVILEP